ncbi:MAG: DUF1320 domain-containing protein [Proteobacteria bacterium]|nr:DUF1320 domain-containing protein [Pseudomonadota bacterium]
MAYITEEDLIAAAGDKLRWEQLVADRPPPDSWNGTAAEFWAEKAIAIADGYVNAILGPRYRTPLAEVNAWLKHEAAEHGVYCLLSSRGGATNEEVRKAELRDQRLQEARDGKRWPAESLPPPSRSRKSVHLPHGDAWSRRKMKGFV